MPTPRGGSVTFHLFMWALVIELGVTATCSVIALIRKKP